MIYLDQSATSWPKPPEVVKAMMDFLQTAGGNPGRSGHSLSQSAGRVISNLRDALADFFQVSDPLRVILTLNATHAINLVLQGFLRPGDRVITSAWEHNSVRRPLNALGVTRGIQTIVIPPSPTGPLDLDLARQIITHDTRLIVMTGASNVTGTVLPIAEVAAIANEIGVPILVDAAQAAGSIPIRMVDTGIDMLVFSGHKGLYGPPGIGGLLLHERFRINDLLPLCYGGTGSHSESEEQPLFAPDRYESGTPNGVGAAGLLAGIQWLNSRGQSHVAHADHLLCGMLCEGLREIPGIVLHQPPSTEENLPIVSFTHSDISVSDFGFELDDAFGILCRVGLHCAPAAHRTIGTFPQGTVRLSPGFFNTPVEMETVLRAIRAVVERRS